MPDRDIFSRVARPGWGRPLRYLYGQASPSDVARAALRSLAASLRHASGLPNLDQLVDTVRECQQGRRTLDGAFSALWTVENRAGHDHTRLGAEVTRQLLADAAEGLSLPTSESAVAEEICERFTRQLVAYHVFERGRPELLHTRFDSEADANAFEDSCWALLGPKVSSLSRRLAANPAAEALKAPPLPRIGRLTTAQLLDTPIG